jgi:hypothetical protein
LLFPPFSKSYSKSAVMEKHKPDDNRGALRPKSGTLTAEMGCRR